MFYGVSWLVVFALLGLWSLAAWALHSFALWSAANVGTVAGPFAGVGGLAVPGWLAPWIPPEAVQALESMLSPLAPAIQSVLSMAPSLAGGLSVAIWVLWALGCIVFIAFGAVLHTLIAMLRRRASKRVLPPFERVTVN